MPHPEWTWTEDRQWASSRIREQWDEPTQRRTWELEVRSENRGVGSLRLGEIYLREHQGTTLTIRIATGPSLTFG